MHHDRPFRRHPIGRAAIASILLAASVCVSPTASFAAEAAVAPEKNPPGDIPDDQVFVDFVSKSGFSLKVPEGWARTESVNGVTFVDKLDGVVVTETAASAPPTPDSVKADYVPTMQKSVRAMKVDRVETVKLPAGKAVRIVYTSNSDPNPVTDKQVRLEDQRYLFFKDGRLVSVELYAPAGADNIDQWQLMTRSFRWN